ncbi:hypothetical protein JW824_14675 [bacterium]|nr:hypothetical protein [bacterium]RQV93464.1 MAG: hypothetical protein EH221_09570 [bacterium]
MTQYKEIDIQKVKTISILDRKSKLDIKDLAKPVSAGKSFRAFWDSLPSVLESRNLDKLVQEIVKAIRHEKPVLMMMGAHVIKVGLSPIVVDFINNHYFRGIAMNGAGAIHDVELAYFGKTSEDVGETIRNGKFGMARETAEILNGTIRDARQNDLGFGEALGKRIVSDKPVHYPSSILGQAYQQGIPVTVHVAVGTDIVHQHSSADGSAIGEASLRDFRIWTHLISQINGGGVVLLFGSTVLLPEVFLKALTVARNIHGDIKDFTTASFDMIRHYRPEENLIKRPVQEGGQGYTLVGHHEIMMPLLFAAIKEKLAG